ncbi:MCP four helix bundle domain-containing protein [Cytophagaceae bacterium DM2B3-1]|uniref:MCP four helix bundle domain-containing protein n=1 Tax=Xanthocytophaga flava TaxID=3048013 RepID=A0ABT7CE20_9BACT|nr:MCP four helix bundle domain-containing protein [Xanthocytophaga flavus]MDJ1470135.1 MCP four helix bundle domain-containing protein [Xanthocytophaga flavus]MDJ1491302.1 MCP four helix bundle domain-containing protein [Xanthocytophaga flavus]
MEKSTNNRSTLRLTLLIASLLGLILTSIFLSRRSVNQIQETSASIYKDRLVPTAIIASLNSKVYQKRLLLESHVLGKTDPGGSFMGSTINRLNRQIDSLLVEYDKTKLTSKESNQFTLLKQRLSVYNHLEEEIIAKLVDQPQEQQTLFAGTAYTTFGQVAQTLTELSSLQLTVGERLLNQSRGQANYMYVLTALQIGLVLIIGFSLFWQRY